MRLRWGCLLLSLGAEGRVFLGVAKFLGLGHQTDYSHVGRFCYVIPRDKKGKLSASTVIKSPGHKLLLTKSADSEAVFSKGLLPFSSAAHAPHHMSAEEMRHQLQAVHFFQQHLESLARLGGGRSLVETNEIPVVVEVGKPMAEMTTATIRRTETSPHVYLTTAVEQQPAPTPAAGVPRPHANSGSQDTVGRLHTVTAHEPGMAAPALPPPIEVRPDADPGGSLDSVRSVCEGLQVKSRVSENLVPVGQRSAYDLILLVDSHVSDTPVDFWITRCGDVPKAEYHISATNPGSFWVRHFSCEEHGVLQVVLFTLLGELLLIPLVRALMATSQSARKEHPALDVYFIACGCTFAHTLGHALHLTAFAYDGLGLRAFAFLADIAHAGFIVSIVFVVIRLILGKRLGSTDTSNTTSLSSFSACQIIPSPDASWSVKITCFVQSLLRVVQVAIMMLLSWTGIWTALSVTAIGALWLQGMRHLTSPIALAVPDFEFVDPTTHDDHSLVIKVLFTAVRLHWCFRIVFALLSLRVIFLRRAKPVPPARMMAAWTAIFWCALIPLHSVVAKCHRHHHSASQFLIPLAVEASNISLLAALGFQIANDSKYCAKAWTLLTPARPLFASRNVVAATTPNNLRSAAGAGNGTTTAAASTPWKASAAAADDDDEALEPQLIDLMRIPQPSEGATFTNI